MQTWTEALGKEKQQPYFRHIIDTVKAERESGQTVYPPAADVFNAFKATEFSQVKAIILGQAPYHGEGQAHGLAVSVRPGIDIPPSLQNIYKELADDIPGFRIPNHGCLQHWAEQGVLLLNTVLTVRARQAHSHAALGWETFTDTVIRRLAERARSSPAADTSSLPRRTPLPCRPTAAFSAANPSRKPTPTCKSTAEHR